MQAGRINPVLLQRKYLLPFVLVTTLCFSEALAAQLNGIFVRQFQQALDLSRSQAGFIQTAFYFGYFFGAIPAGLAMKRFDYKNGILIGLVLYCAGILMFYAVAEVRVFGIFLTALYTIAFGLVFLESAANPYVSMMGDARTGPSMFNIVQSLLWSGHLNWAVSGQCLHFQRYREYANETRRALVRRIGSLAQSRSKVRAAALSFASGLFRRCCSLYFFKVSAVDCADYGALPRSTREERSVMQMRSGFKLTMTDRPRFTTRLVHLLCAIAMTSGLITTSAPRAEETASGRWTEEQANEWYSEQNWPVGFNYVPRYAINQIEMWQDDTFDPDVIEEELSWARDVGFNTARVYLHNLLWQEDENGFLEKIDRFLSIADANDIRVILVLFDDVWDPNPRLGVQRQPIPHTHNSGWVQGPGKEILHNLSRHDELQGYVTGIIRGFADDDRVLMWDLYNEPGNPNGDTYASEEADRKKHYSLQLLKKVFFWARSVSPSQPLTSGVWRYRNGQWIGVDPESDEHWLFRFMLDNSDVITFHIYRDPTSVVDAIEYLKHLGRPMICTEYLAREMNNRFETVLPIFSASDVGAIHWGLVSGKSQTIYPWRSWRETFHSEPTIWHHDFFREDGEPYSADERDFVQNLIEERVGRGRSD